MGIAAAGTSSRRRTRTLVAMTAIMAIALVGCGGQTEEEDPAVGSGTDDTSPTDAEDTAGADGEPVRLSIAANAVKGGKNSEEATWLEDYVAPTFQERMQEQGRDVTVEFKGRGVDDEAFKAQLALDLKSGAGADIMSIDGIWVGEFAQAGYLEPLSEVAGDAWQDWDGWEQIPDAVEKNMAFDGSQFGIPAGTDGRVLYFNKDLFEQAGLPTDWQPASWQEILDAAETIKSELPDVTPLQINAGTAMGEATTMQGALPLLVGTGERIYDEEAGAWMGASSGLEEVLAFYDDIYNADPPLGDKDLQLRQDGRDRSFQEFAEGKIAVLAEGDYFWRSVINPDEGVAPMENRDEVVGWAKIPAREPGAGIEGQDFVSMSGGSGRVLNPNTDAPELAWELLTFMNSKEATLELVSDQARITQRLDVNQEILSGDLLLQYVSEEVLPITAYRPGLAEYPQVSVALQEATEAVVTGTDPSDAAAGYESQAADIVGADNVAGG